MTALTRRYRFSASHRLHTPELTDEENARVFGKCNNPFGHGHDYVLDVTVAGTVDERTGRILRIEDLDRLVADHVLRNFANRYLNVDVPQFSGLTATTENAAQVIATLLKEHWSCYFAASSASLSRIRIQETDRNSVEVRC